MREEKPATIKEDDVDSIFSILQDILLQRVTLNKKKLLEEEFNQVCQAIGDTSIQEFSFSLAKYVTGMADDFSWKLEAENLLKYGYSYGELETFSSLIRKPGAIKNAFDYVCKYVKNEIDFDEYEEKINEKDEFSHVYNFVTSEIDVEMDESKLNECEAKIASSFKVVKEFLINKIKEDNFTEEWKSFIPPSKTITVLWKNDQEKWGKLCSVAIDLSIKEEFKSAFDLYVWFARVRYQIANILNQKRETVFGLMRMADLVTLSCGLYTNISSNKNSPYADQFEECSNLLEEMENKQFENIKHHSVNVILENKEKIIDVIVIMDPKTQTALTKLYRTADIYNNRIIKICHPPAIRSLTLFENHIGPLYKKILLEQNEEEKYYLLGKISYYLAHATPAQAGSAAISDMFIRRTMKLCNISIRPYASHLNWGLIAMFTPDVESYAKNFRSLFADLKKEKATGCPSTSKVTLKL